MQKAQSMIASRLGLLSLIPCLLLIFQVASFAPGPAGIPTAQAQNKPAKKTKKKKPNTTDGKNRKTGKKKFWKQINC